MLALEYLHEELAIIHRDIKPENILIDADGYVALADFGISDLCRRDGAVENQGGALYGTLPYTAPELLRREEYDFAADYWQLGVLLYELLFADVPFSEVKKIVKSALELPRAVSPACCDLLYKLFEKDPSKRIR